MYPHENKFNNSPMNNISSESHDTDLKNKTGINLIFWSICCIISHRGFYFTAKTLVQIPRCVSPDATTNYKRPFSVTENLSKYQNVKHLMTVCMLTVAFRTRTS